MSIVPAVSTTHLVLIPSYNPGAKGVETVRSARAQWAPVWVVIDGSTDDSTERLMAMAEADPALRVWRLPRNSGKGAAVLSGLQRAQVERYTHALVMDSDGQHPASRIAAFMQASRQSPAALILGRPVFDADAPAVRVNGRKISNWLANLETLWAGVGDSLFGFRVYPIDALIEIMQRRRWMRRFDFDVEAAVRLTWHGLQLVNLPAAVRYFRIAEGGVSHFNYLRDNCLLAWMHCRLLCELVPRLPTLWRRRGLSRR